MPTNTPIDDAQTSVVRLWSAHLRFRASLAPEEAAALAGRVETEDDFALGMFEHLQSLSDPVSSCAHDSDEAFASRPRAFLDPALSSDPLLAAMTRFVLDSEADSMLGWFDRLDPEGTRARRRLAGLRDVAGAACVTDH